MNVQEQMEITQQGTVAVTKFKTEHLTDMETIDSASRQLEKYIEENKPIKVVFDFEKVKFFSSQVLGLLLDIRAKLQASDGEVVISSIDPQLYRIFKITRLDRIFRFFQDSKSAIKSAETGMV